MKLELSWDSGRRMGIISGDVFDDVREVFSVENPAAKLPINRHNPWIPDRRYAITPTGRFDAGLLIEIVKYAHKTFPGIQIVIDPILQSQVLSPIRVPVLENLSKELRYYQKEIVQKCLQQGRGTVVLATAGGKTLTMAALINSIYETKKDLKCLVLVPDLGLVNQTFGDFADYKVTFSSSKWTGKNELNLASNVIIANLGILQSKNSNTDWIADVDLFIVDEVHKLRKDNKVNNLFKELQTEHRFGFTGTLPENLLDQWNIIGKVGPVLYEKHSAELEKEKYVAPVKSVVLRLHYQHGPPEIPREEITSPTQRYQAEIDFLIRNPFRNRVIGSLCNKLDNNVLILVDYIEHGETLFTAVKDACPNKEVFFIRGDVEVEARQKVMQIMETQQNVVVVAISKIFSTGINIRQLCYLLFASGGKAKIKVVQSIGRGRRLHENKKELLIFDIADQLHYGMQHVGGRLKLYKQEEIPFAFKDICEKPQIFSL